jgi:CheY-like chemotaxis protein
LYPYGRFPAFLLSQCFKGPDRPDVFKSHLQNLVGPEHFMPLLALLIDDSMLIRHTVARFLENRGFAVETATDGLAALDTLKAIRPDVIFTDLQMPRLSGYGLIDALKANPETADIPIVVLAARPPSGDLSTSGIHSIIYKDLNVEQQLSRSLDRLFPSGTTL